MLIVLFSGLVAGIAAFPTNGAGNMTIEKSWIDQNPPYRSICYRFVKRVYTDQPGECYEYQPDCSDLNNVANTSSISDTNCYDQNSFTNYANNRWNTVLNNFHNNPITSTVSSSTTSVTSPSSVTTPTSVAPTSVETTTCTEHEPVTEEIEESCDLICLIDKHLGWIMGFF